jgi:DNA-binding IclR family transcriptional regulator
VVACPVRDAANALVGILSINGPVQRLKSDQLPDTIDQLRQAAQDISKALS